MIDRLSASLNFYSRALDLRNQRTNVLASNIANSDTPGYKARDFDFRSALDAAVSNTHRGGLALARTSANHIAGTGTGTGTGTAAPRALQMAYVDPTQPSLDGNTVDMNAERVKFMQNAIHYRADLKMLDGQIKSLKTALQPVP